MAKGSAWVVAGVALVLAACAGPPTGDPSPAAVGDTTTDSPAEWSGATLHVPAEYPTIQAAVDSAEPGDLILIDRGVFKEQVTVTTPGLTLRGVDRNEVIIDGEFERANGVLVLANGVVVENMTAMNNTGNGFFWTGVRGYRGSYLTAVNNAIYGIYAFNSGDGIFDHSYASGSQDAGFYIGQCNPCDAVITDSIAEHNGLGYSGSNASTEIYLVNSVWRYNGTGMVPNTLDGELIPPAENVVIAGNLIHDNGYGDFPHLRLEWTAQGNGIMLPGVVDSLITKNRIVNSAGNGIQLNPNPDENVWMAGGNTVTDNVIEGSGLADLTMTGPSQSGNCFEGNEHSSSLPPVLQFKQGCDGLRFPALWELGSLSAQFGRLLEYNLGLAPDVDYTKLAHPGPQPQMPGGAAADVTPAYFVYEDAKPDLDSIHLPEMPPDLKVTQEKGFNIMGVSFASTLGGVIGLYAYVLPLVLYTAWVVLALWDISRREDLGKGAGLGWMGAILVIPFLGVVAYYIFGKSTISVAQRWVLLAGGLGVYALFLVIGLVVGGVV